MEKIYLVIRNKHTVSRSQGIYTEFAVCNKKSTAYFESGGTEEGGTIYVNTDLCCSGDWKLLRYKGYDIDYGLFPKQDFILFDGSSVKELNNSEKVKQMIKNSTWWSADSLPQCLKKLGVKETKDAFVKNMILRQHEDILNIE